MNTPQEIVEAALAASTADGCIVIVTDRSEANLRWANNSLTTNGEMASRSLVVISTVGAGSGTAAGVVDRSVTDVADVREVVEASETAARASEPASDAAPLVTVAEATAGVHFDDAPEPTSIGVFDTFAHDLGQVLRESHGSDRVHFGFAEQITETVYLGTSTGVRLRHVQPTGRLELNAKSPDWSRSSYLGFSVRNPSEADIFAANDELGKRLGWAANQISLEAGRHEVILPPTAMADLYAYSYFMAAAKDADEGRSPYSKADGGSRIGERLGALPLTMFSDPAYDGLQCAPFAIVPASAAEISVFDNGLPIGRTDWIKDGVLSALSGPRSWAAQTKTPTYQPVDNLVITGDPASSTASLMELVGSTKRGLLLSTLWYIRIVDSQTLLMTGLTRDGVYLVEDGEIVGAVNNFRFNESPLSLLGRISEVGATERCYPREWGDWFTRAAMPPARVPDFNMSSVSQAL